MPRSPRRAGPLGLVLAFVLLLASLAAAPASSAQAAKKRTTTYASLSATSVKVGKTAQVRSAVRPKHRGHTVYLQQKVGARWKSVQHKALSSTSRAVFTVRGSSAGTKYYRVYDPATRYRKSSISKTLKLVVKKAAATSSQCTPGYSPCIAPGPDVDCAGGSGDGPRYVEGPILVTGSDPYKLDNDHDGFACQS